MSRPFPKFHAHGTSIVADGPCGQFEAPADHWWLGDRYLVAESIVNPALLAFIVEACNSAGSYAEATANLVAAKTSYLAARAILEGIDAEPAEPVFGWYAGLSLESLSVGPLPTREAAIEAARQEHGSGSTIFLVEAPSSIVEPEPFTGEGSRIERVCEWIEADLARQCGDGVLPPLRSHHEDDLADRLNAAVRDWMAEHAIKPITNKLGPARTVLCLIPHEVDSVTTTRVHNAGRVARRLGTKTVFVDEIDPYPTGVEIMPFPAAEPFVFEGRPGDRSMQPIRSGYCAGCAEPTDCGREGCARKLAIARVATFAKGNR